MGYAQEMQQIATIKKLQGKIGGMGRAFAKLQAEYNSLDTINNMNKGEYSVLKQNYTNAMKTIKEQTVQINKLYLEISEEKKYRTNDPKLTMEIDKLGKEITKLRNKVKDLEEANKRLVLDDTINLEYISSLQAKRLALEIDADILKSAGCDTVSKVIIDKLEKDLKLARKSNGELQARNCQLSVALKKEQDIKSKLNEEFENESLDAVLILAMAGVEVTQQLVDSEAKVKLLTSQLKDQDKALSNLNIGYTKNANIIECQASKIKHLQEQNDLKDIENAKLKEELSTLVHNHKGKQPSIWDYDRELFRIHKKSDEDTIIRLVGNEYGYFIDARVWMNERPTTRGLCLKVDQFFDLNKQLKSNRNVVDRLIKEEDKRGAY